MALDYNSINTVDELIAAINSHVGTPQQPPLTGADMNVILRKIVDLTTHETKTYANIAARDAETGDWPDFAFVVDATGDSTVEAGAALYYNNSHVWTKVVETADLDLVLQWVNITGKPNLEFTGDITVKLNGNKFGKYSNGDVIAATGKTANDVLIDALSEVIHPVYNAPQAAITSTPAPTPVEAGTPVSILLDTAFTQNDGGSYTGLSIKKNGTSIASAEPYTDAAVAIGLTPILYQAFYSYAQGPVKQNNMLEDDTTGRINSGSIGSNIISYQGYNKIFFGSSAAVPASSSDVRALAGGALSNAGNQIILNTGTANKIFAFAIPAGKVLLSVIDLDASGMDLTADYANSTLSVNDAGGNASTYNLYVKQQGVTYLSSHRHQINLTDE